MGIFDRFKKKKEVDVVAEIKAAPIETPPKKTKTAPTSKKTAKEIADEKSEPYVAIISVELDPDNIGNRSFCWCLRKYRLHRHRH